MIAHLKGIIQSKGINQLIVDVNGVGYQVSVSLNTFYELPPEGMEVSLHIHTHLREDHLALFGFLTLDEKNLFQNLIKVNGVGPKLAMTLLSGLSPHQIIEAIAGENAGVLKSIPGIGQKVSERILIDLKGKLQLPAKSGKQATASQSFDEALSALTHLGYTSAQAQKTLGILDWSKGLTIQEALRLSLKNLAKG